MAPAHAPARASLTGVRRFVADDRDAAGAVFFTVGGSGEHLSESSGSGEAGNAADGGGVAAWFMVKIR